MSRHLLLLGSLAVWGSARGVDSQKGTAERYGPGGKKLPSEEELKTNEWYPGNQKKRPARTLHEAIIDREVDFDEVTTLVKEKGADLEERDGAGRTPLMVACLSGADDLVEALLELGADPLTHDAQGGTAAHMAASMGHAGVLQQLYLKGRMLWGVPARPQCIEPRAVARFANDCPRTGGCHAGTAETDLACGRVHRARCWPQRT